MQDALRMWATKKGKCWITPSHLFIIRKSDVANAMPRQTGQAKINGLQNAGRPAPLRATVAQTRGHFPTCIHDNKGLLFLET